MADVTYLIIQLAIIVAAFLVGKYVTPNVSGETIANVTAKINIIITYAEKFVSWAKQFMSSSTGSEKMAAVVEQLQKIADKYGIDVTEEELQAIAQNAYDAMVAGEAAATTTNTVILETNNVEKSE